MITGSVDIGNALRIVTVNENPELVTVDGIPLVEYLPCGSIIVDERDGDWFRIACSESSGGTEDRNLVPGFPSSRTVFVPAKYEPSATRGNFAVQSITSNSGGFLNFNIPDDFESIISLELMGIPTASALTQNIDLFSTYAARLEPFNEHEESNTTITFDLVADTINLFDIVSVFSQITANDICGIQIDHNSITGKIDYLGTRMIYRI